MSRVNLIVLRSSDLAKAATFYEVLGVEFKKHAHGSGPQHLAYEGADGLVFEIYPLKKSEDSTAKTRIGFAVSDVDAVLAGLEELGASVRQPAANSEWGRRAVVADFDGHTVELTAPATI